MELFKLLGTIYIDNDKANASLAKTGNQAEQTGGKLGSLTNYVSDLINKNSGLSNSSTQLISTMGGIDVATVAAAAGFVALAAAAVKALADITAQASQVLDTVDKMSQRLGLSTEAYQEWDYIMKMSGSDIDSMTTGMKKLNETVLSAMEGTEKSIETLLKLHIVPDELENLSQEDAFELVVERFQEMEDGAEKAALATEIFGKTGTNIIPLLNAEAGSIDVLKQRANDLGLVFDEQAVSMGAEYGDALTTMKDAFAAIGTSIGVQLMPYFKDFVAWVTENIPKIRKIVENVTAVLIQSMKQFAPLFKIAITEISAILDVVVVVTDGIRTAVDSVVSFIEDKIQKVIDMIYTLSGGLIDLGASATKIENLYPNRESYKDQYGFTSLKPKASANGNILSSGDVSTVGESGMELVRMVGNKAVVTPMTGNSSSNGNIFNITIDAASVKEFSDIVEIAQQAQMRKRMGTV